jgi:hypothetical protein
MKGLKTLTATVSAAALLTLGLVPASAPAAGAYNHYVACGVSQNAKPSHVCQKGRKKGAFFESNNGTVFYKVCVRFPEGKHICAPREEATEGILYVNKITTNIVGKHRVSWYVEGKKVGSYVFRVPG